MLVETGRPESKLFLEADKGHRIVYNSDTTGNTVTASNWKTENVLNQVVDVA